MTREEFLADVATHQMTIHRDDGAYRHVEFRKPHHGWHHWFEIVTWPNCLAIRGDMGSWMFSRTYDMFGFFRAPSEAPGRINPNYWAEKLQHGSGSAIRSAKNFSIDVLKRQARDFLDNYEMTPRERNEIEAELDALLDGYTDGDEHEALNALFNFRQGQVHFDPCDGPFGLEWSYHYLWCLHAIVWAIDRWDARDTR